MNSKYRGVILFLCAALIFLASCQSKETANYNSGSAADESDKILQESTVAATGGEPDKETKETERETYKETEGASQTDTGKESSTKETQGQNTSPTQATQPTKPENPTDATAPGGITPPGEQTDLETKVQYYLGKLTLEEKICQMFIVHPEKLVNDAKAYTAAGEATRQAINRYPVGGVIYFANNLNSPAQVKEMLANTQKYSMDRIGLPAFLCVDEEGGTVARIAGNPNFNVTRFDNMSVIGAGGDRSKAYHVGDTIGSYLAQLGFNVDFAPVADVWSNPNNTVIKLRSFGSNPQTVSDMALEVSRGLSRHGVSSAFKHFPGHGATEGDTHEGYAYTSKTLEQLRQCELIPFQKAAEANADFIMVAHISLPNVTGDNTPASLSSVMIRQVLRQELGYNGIVITDAMQMGAIAQHYSTADGTVAAVRAGVDIILMPNNLEEAYTALLTAVQNGKISEQRINESVARILRVKLKKA